MATIISRIIDSFKNVLENRRLATCIFASSCANFAISQVLFSRAMIPLIYKLDEWLTDVAVLLSFIDADDLLPLTIVTGLSAFNVNMDKLKKMHNLWEPPTHPVLYLGHTTAVFALLEVINRQNPDQRESSGFSSKYGCTKRLITISAACLLWILLPLRVGEMHYIVIALNFVHIFLITCVVDALRCALCENRSNKKCL